jgi:hypothetical protein
MIPGDAAGTPCSLRRTELRRGLRGRLRRLVDSSKTHHSKAGAQGEQAALAAIELLEGQRVGKRDCQLSLELIVRESCGAKLLNPSLNERQAIG